MITVAMVLAAGRGERMRPLSDALPKPALPLPEGPVIGSAMRLAAAAGCRRIVVNLWHLASRMRQAALAAAPAGMAVRFSSEPELMGTAGGLALASSRGLLEGDGPVLVVNGDGLLELDLRPLVDRHREAGDDVTLALLPHPDPDRWSRVVLDGEGRVVSIRRPEAGADAGGALLFPGVMLVSRAALARLAVEPSETAERLWFPAMASGRLGGAVVSGRWREVGTPDGYLDAVLAGLAGSSRVTAGAAVAADVVLRSSLVADGAEVGPGATVVRSVLAGGARVGAGATVEASVLLGAVEVPPGGRLVGEHRALPATP